MKRRAHGEHVWEFKLGDVIIDHAGKQIRLQYPELYRLQVNYRNDREPRVYLLEPAHGPRTHVWKDDDGRLCLYKPTNWQWKSFMKFDTELFPQIVMWLYYHEIWTEHGVWCGEEAKHDRRRNFSVPIIS